jgi:hypothetical protein
MISVETNQKLNEFSELVSFLTLNVMQGASTLVVSHIQSEIETVLSDIRLLNANLHN